MKNVTGDSDCWAAAMGDSSSGLVVEASGYVTQPQIHDQMIIFASESKGSIAMAATTGTDLEASFDTTGNDILDMLDSPRIYEKGRSMGYTCIEGGCIVDPVGALRAEEWN
ncbi:hypothetical protein VP1G_03480 [Cytospora mali]|uniref:Uncharacterized protein n=1 Tax=Cytospora mali TaxID=578113 RepID=A0A194UWU8_CYTMA|nr:hypothetical protein VP1G_03480 [Valsa mali var. pyri (nom. inval.)]